jgi:hypothetical protein
MEDGQSTGFFKMHQLGAGRDYNTWRRYFMANAELKDFADVLLEGPAAAAAALEGTERREWEAKDRKAKAAMLLAVGEEYLDLVGDAATAREAWVALEGVAVGEIVVLNFNLAFLLSRNKRRKQYFGNLQCYWWSLT